MVVKWVRKHIYRVCIWWTRKCGHYTIRSGWTLQGSISIYHARHKRTTHATVVSRVTCASHRHCIVVAECFYSDYLIFGKNSIDRHDKITFAGRRVRKKAGLCLYVHICIGTAETQSIWNRMCSWGFHYIAQMSLKTRSVFDVTQIVYGSTRFFADESHKGWPKGGSVDVQYSTRSVDFERELLEVSRLHIRFDGQFVFGSGYQAEHGWTIVTVI